MRNGWPLTRNDLEKLLEVVLASQCQGDDFVEHSGIEPLTSSLRTKRSTN